MGNLIIRYWCKITVYLMLSLIYVFSGLSFLGKMMNKMHSFFKRIISFPLINVLPLLAFLLTYIYSLFIFFDNVCNSFILYYRTAFQTILLYFVFASPVLSYFVLLFAGSGPRDPKELEKNYCYQKKCYYIDYNSYCNLAFKAITKKNRWSYLVFTASVSVSTFVFSLYSLILLYLKVGSQNDGKKVPAALVIAVPFWISEARKADITLLMPLLATIPTFFWSLLTSIDTFQLMARRKSRAELFCSQKQKTE
jgi:hypothetical protein